ncbi:MAG: ACT domain-containing protein [Clostridium sp.]|nr:ACT domain-containing protein [Clostridium sp.]
MLEKILTMRLLKEKYGVCRLDKTDLIPEWTKDSDFFSITKTSDELSIVCFQDSIPNDVKCERDWRILKIEGPLDFSLIGILASISAILAQKGISIFAISTYDTDYILVKDKDINNAIEALVNERYEVITRE